MNALSSSQKPLFFHFPFNSSRQSKWNLNATAKGFGNSSNPKKPTLSTTLIEPEIKKKNGPPSKLGGRVEKADEIPQEVFERMTARIFVAVGVPMGFGLGLLSLIGYVKERNLADLPMWIPFMTTLFTFSVSIMGIAYGGLSTSLDKDKKGSWLGFEEAKENWVEMWKEEEKKEEDEEEEEKFE